MSNIRINIMSYELKIHATITWIPQKRKVLDEDNTLMLRKETGKLLDQSFSKETHLHIWETNLVIAKKFNGKW